MKRSVFYLLILSWFLIAAVPAIASPLVGRYNTPGDALDVAVSGNYAYVADGWAGLLILDISNPSKPTPVGSHGSAKWARGVAVSGSYAYVADGRGGLLIFDVSSPTSPALVGKYDKYPYYRNRSVAVSGSYAYVGSSGHGLLIFEVSNPTSPSLVGSYNTSSGDVEKVALSGNHVYVVDRHGGLLIFDVSNPTKPFPVGSYDTPGKAQGVIVSGNHAYVADGRAGVTILDLSNPTSPTVVAQYNMSKDARGVAVSGDHLYVADGKGGLMILDVSDPTKPTPVNSYETPGVAHGVVLSPTHAYIADGKQGGLVILDISEFSTKKKILADCGDLEVPTTVTTPTASSPKAYLPSPTAVQHYKKGKSHLQAGSLVEAEEELEAAVRLAPSYVEALEGLASVYRKKGKMTHYQALLKRAEEVRRRRSVVGSAKAGYDCLKAGFVFDCLAEGFKHPLLFTPTTYDLAKINPDVPIQIKGDVKEGSLVDIVAEEISTNTGEVPFVIHRIRGTGQLVITRIKNIYREHVKMLDALVERHDKRVLDKLIELIDDKYGRAPRRASLGFNDYYIAHYMRTRLVSYRFDLAFDQNELDELREIFLTKIIDTRAHFPDPRAMEKIVLPDCRVGDYLTIGHIHMNGTPPSKTDLRVPNYKGYFFLISREEVKKRSRAHNGIVISHNTNTHDSATIYYYEEGRYHKLIESYPYGLSIKGIFNLFYNKSYFKLRRSANGTIQSIEVGDPNGISSVKDITYGTAVNKAISTYYEGKPMKVEFRYPSERGDREYFIVDGLGNIGYLEVEDNKIKYANLLERK